MANIALAESGGNPNANNYTDNNGKQTSWGLWQVSDGTHNAYAGNMNDPLTNAKAAVAKYNGGGFMPWRGDANVNMSGQYIGPGGPPSNVAATGQGGSQGQTTDIYQNPVIGDVPAPPSQAESATNFFETQRSGEYQANNLLNIFNTIQKRLANPDPVNDAHVRGTPLVMK